MNFIMASDSANRRLFLLLVSAFFVSGFSALLYQVVWQRMLGLFSGSDVRSVTIVAGAYLAGLGVGSLIGGLYADRLTGRQALRVFGLCNIGIAAFAIGSHFLFYNLLFQEWYVLAKLPAMMLLIVFISLLWPTTLMGLSLPLLSKAVVGHISQAARLISLLYGINTLGAAAGTFLSGWYLVGTLGYEVTVYLGGLLSLLVGFTALWIAPQFSSEAYDETTPPPTSELKQKLGSFWLWCLLVFISGFIAISLELLWFRLLDVSLQSNAYTFGHFLGFILFGYAIASLDGGRVVKRVKNPRSAFLWLQGGVALFSVLSIWVIAIIIKQGWLERYLVVFVQNQGRITLSLDQPFLIWLGYIIGYLLLPAVILLPPNLLIGLGFPISQQAVQTDSQQIGRRIGLIQVANILGNTTGAILTGLWLLDEWGMAGCLRVIAALGLFLVLVSISQELFTFRRLRQPMVQPGLFAAGMLTLGLLITLITFPNNTQLWSWLHRTLDHQLFVVTEDSTGVTALQESNNQARIYINGQSQGTVPYYIIHSVLGSVGTLFHPDPKRILVIGIGSGGTPYNAGVNPQTEYVLAVEIVGSVLPTLKAYAQETGGQPLRPFLADPRYEMVIGDGRRELALSETRFDVIEADAIYPWRSHAGLLYSKEFFEEALSKLAEGGIMVQWAPTERIKATFLSVFPHGLAIDNHNILLGSNQPIANDSRLISERLTNPDFITYWQQGGVDPAQIRQMIEAASIVAWTPTTPRQTADINTDLFPRDEYYLNND